METQSQLQDKMREMEVINWALAARERKSSDELQDIRKEMSDVIDDRDDLNSLNHVLLTKEIESNNELQAVRKSLIDVSEQRVPYFFSVNRHYD
jgi:flagellar biosynthesis/type III secretory pathway chaperone